MLAQAIFTAGYKAVLHIHSVVEECEIVELMQQIDLKTKKPMKKKPLFVKNGAIVLCRVQVSCLTEYLVDLFLQIVFNSTWWTFRKERIGSWIRLFRCCLHVFVVPSLLPFEFAEVTILTQMFVNSSIS